MDTVKVKNYAGLTTEARNEGSSSKGTTISIVAHEYEVSSQRNIYHYVVDPRYEVVDGRRVPSFYVTEVEEGRKRILEMLQNHKVHREDDVMRVIPGSDYRSRYHPDNCESSKFHHQNRNLYTGVTNVSYCYNISVSPTTLTCMPIALHGERLQCNHLLL